MVNSTIYAYPTLDAEFHSISYDLNAPFYGPHNGHFQLKTLNFFLLSYVLKMNWKVGCLSTMTIFCVHQGRFSCTHAWEGEGEDWISINKTIQIYLFFSAQDEWLHILNVILNVRWCFLRKYWHKTHMCQWHLTQDQFNIVILRWLPDLCWNKKECINHQNVQLFTSCPLRHSFIHPHHMLYS